MKKLYKSFMKSLRSDSSSDKAALSASLEDVARERSCTPSSSSPQPELVIDKPPKQAHEPDLEEAAMDSRAVLSQLHTQQSSKYYSSFKF
jgi:hypothetical protein